MCATDTTTTKTAVKAETGKWDAYGKVKTIRDPIWKQLLHVDEIFTALSLLLFHRPYPLGSSNYVKKHFDPDLIQYVADLVMENDVIHICSLILRLLPPPVLIDGIVMSQVLRAVDCIEDEPMPDGFYKEDLNAKCKAMLEFHRTALVDPNWSLPGVGESPSERKLMEEFPKIHALFKALKPESQKVVVDVTEVMAKGMVDFLQIDLTEGPKTCKQYDDYCYAISGYVCVCVARVWAIHGVESPEVASKKNEHLAIEAGNMSIKQTFIFTFAEDYMDKRVKWPQEIWKQYSPTGSLNYFLDKNPADPKMQHVKKIQCVNAMVTDALQSLPDGLRFLEQIKTYEDFWWTASVAVATTAQLDHCYANADVYKACVFIRPGIIAKLIAKANTLQQVHESIHNLATSIKKKAERLDPALYGPDKDPGFKKTMDVCNTLIAMTKDGAAAERKSRWTRRIIGMSIFAVAGGLAFFQPSITTDKDDNKNKWKLASTLLVGAASTIGWWGPSWTAPGSGKLKKWVDTY